MGSLEKLPTYRRMKKGILTGEGGEVMEIDIQNRGYQEKKQLLERLLRVTEEDNEKFLLKLKDRIDRVGIHVPTIELRLEHLNVIGEAYAGFRASPTVLNFAINMIEDSLCRLHILSYRKIPFSILSDVSGIIKPGRMTLLLGPPQFRKDYIAVGFSGKAWFRSQDFHCSIVRKYSSFKRKCIETM